MFTGFMQKGRKESIQNQRPEAESGLYLLIQKM